METFCKVRVRESDSTNIREDLWPSTHIDYSQISGDASWETNWNISSWFPSTVVSSVIFLSTRLSLWLVSPELMKCVAETC